MNPDGNGNLLEKYASPLPSSGSVNIQESQRITPQPQAGVANEPQQASSMLFAPETNEQKKKDLFFIAWAKGAVRTGERVAGYVGQKVVKPIVETSIKVIEEGAKRVEEPIVEKKDEAKETIESWKAYIKAFGLPAAIIAVVLGGFVYWRAKEGDLNPNLGEDIFKGVDKIWKKMTGQRVIDESDKPPDIVKEEDQQRYLNNYIDKGMNDPIVNIAPVTDIAHFSQIDKMTELTAAGGGPSWMLPVIEIDGQVRPVATADMLAEQLAEQLTGATKQEILDNWIDWHNDPQAFLNFLSSHGANQQVVNNYQCAIQVAQADTTSLDTWTDRLDATRACLVKKQGRVPAETVETHGKSGLAAPAEVKHDNSLEIAARIVEDNLKIEGVAVQPLIAKAVEVAQDLVINHQLPDHDDAQALLTAAILAGDRLVKEIEELPREVHEALEVRAHQHAEVAQSVQPDHIFQSPAEAINYVTGGGGIPMLIILVIECGLAEINSAIYIQRAKETRDIPLKSEEELRKDAVNDMLDFEKELDRGMPNGYIPAGKITQEHSLGITIGGNVAGKGEVSGRAVIGEVVIEGEQIKTNSPEYQGLVKQLKRGIPLNAWNSLESKGLLISQKENEAAPFVKAADLMMVIQEMNTQGQNQGEFLVGEPDWYN